jgi:CrcB protein
VVKLSSLLLVGAGGFVGAITRFVVATWAQERWGSSWPFGTFLINVTGCFAIGLFLTLAAERFAIADHWRLVFSVGFVGAFTTFSTYEYETLRLIETGAWPRALSYVLLSTVVGFAAVGAAAWAARRLF